jgi:hypothetical protein
LSSRTLVALPKNLIASLSPSRNSSVTGLGGSALPASCAPMEWNENTTCFTTRNRAFAESKHLWREPPPRLSVKKASPRVKKISRAKIKILRREFFLALGEEILKNHFSPSIFFLSSTRTYTKDMFKLTQFYVCLLYLKILLHSRYFFRRRPI